MSRRARRRARRAAAVPVALTIGAIMDTGLWCDDCLLPSGVRYEVLDGTALVGSCIACEDCGALLNEPTT